MQNMLASAAARVVKRQGLVGARSISSRLEGLKNAASLMTPEQRAKQAKTDEVTLRIQKAQRERRRMLKEQYGELVDEPTPGGGGVTGSALDAKLTQLEKQGAFKNLKGAGKPLPHRAATHFGDEDAADRMFQRIMAENNVKPESVELRLEYLPRFKAFKARLQQMPAPGASRQKALQVEHAELLALHHRFTGAAVKDSFTFKIGIPALPKLLPTLEEELAQAGKSR